LFSVAGVNAQFDVGWNVNRDSDATFGGLTVDVPQSLDNFVAQLNEITKHHKLGKTQEPLTADEVIGAIRRWSNNPEATPETKAKFNRIVETGVLNAGDKLSFSTGLTSDGICYTVWWLDLTVDRYVFRIRDRTVSSRPQTKEEIALHKRNVAEIKKQLEDLNKTPDHHQ
jgi:hypothetical protein